MTVTPTSAASATSATTASDSVSAGRTRLADNFDMFLTLLTTQMKNQDPMSPMDSTQFTQQLVQMTGVEQQLAANDLLKQLVANTGTNVSGAVGLIGKQVRAATSDARLANGQASWLYNLPADASDVKFEVLDSQGRTVDVKAGGIADGKAGDHSFTWDGRSTSGSNMPDGTYTLRITATTASGDTVANTTYVQGLVSAIEQNSSGQAVVTVNGTKVPVSQVVSVTEPPAPSNSNSASAGDTATGANSSNPADQTSAAAA